MSRSHRRIAAGFAAVLAAIVPAGLAWACVAPVSFTTVMPTVQPGGTIRVIGREMAPGADVEIRLDSVTGKLLTTVTGQPGGMNAKWEQDVMIPADLPYGKHYLYAVQNYRNMNVTIPRTAIYVGTLPDPEPELAVRVSGLDVGSGPSGVRLVLFGLGAAGIALFAAGAMSMLSGSGRPKAEAQPVKAS